MKKVVFLVVATCVVVAGTVIAFAPEAVATAFKGLAHFVGI